VLLLLRERLNRLDRGRGKQAGRTGSTASATAPPMARLQALAAVEELPQDELRRTLVRALLSEELGEAVTSDPSFAEVADEVYRVISDSEEGQALMERATRELRAKA